MILFYFIFFYITKTFSIIITFRENKVFIIDIEQKKCFFKKTLIKKTNQENDLQVKTDNVIFIRFISSVLKWV